MFSRCTAAAPRLLLFYSRRWIVQIPEEIRKSVFFVLFLTKDGYKLAGTGFFVSMPVADDPNRMFIYLITARHVIVEAKRASIDGKIWLRVNTKTGFEYVVTEGSAWHTHSEDSSIDAAVLSWAPDSTHFDYMTIPNSLIVNEEIISKEAIGIGDEVFLVGLFVNHHGRKKNIPIVRVGNIAAMPEEPVVTRLFGDMEAYLIEARSIGGLSGSPVFVYLPGVRVRGNALGMGGRAFYWLGLMHGHWDLPILKEDMVVEDSVSKEAVNMGIGVVVPATKILEVINIPIFVGFREIEIKKLNDVAVNDQAIAPEVGITL